MPEPPKHGGLWIGLAAATCALALASCGSAGQAGTTDSVKSFTSSKVFASFLRFAECMRAHGVPNFPDPTPGQGGIGLTLRSGLNPLSPAFQSAQQSCRRLLPGGGPPRELPESVKLRLLAFARCMRAHGVTSFPDPTFQGGARIEPPLGVAGISPTSPTFQSAARACGKGRLAVGG